MADVTHLDPVLPHLAESVRSALRAADLPDADPALERPRQPDHGDWATPVAMGLAKEARMAPREIAERLVAHLEAPEQVGAVDVAGPGFVNFRLAHRYFEDVVRRILDVRQRFGRWEAPTTERINLEFVSANPTGPLHVGAGRWAALGDAIGALLEAQGHEVTREYYFNDAGRQMRMLGESVVRTHRGEPLEDDHYRGAYIAELVEEIVADAGAGFFEGDEDDVAGLRDRFAEASPRTPAVWVLMFEEGSPTELLQWATLGYLTVVAGILGGALTRDGERSAGAFWKLVAVAGALMIAEDAGNVRHRLVRYAEAFAGLERDPVPWHLAVEFVWFAIIAGVLVTAVVRHGRAVLPAAATVRYGLAGVAAYALAVLGSVTRDIDHWYADLGRWIERSLLGTELLLPEGWSRFHIHFFLVDYVVEESLELLGAALLLAAALAYHRDAFTGSADLTRR
jgi:hypothetical protein